MKIQVTVDAPDEYFNPVEARWLVDLVDTLDDALIDNEQFEGVVVDKAEIF